MLLQVRRKAKRDSMKGKIERLDDFGRGIAYINGKICFIENALPEELVEIKIIKEKKKYYEAKVLNYLEKSNRRQVSNCPYYYLCGGCNLEHISLEEENKFKAEKVKNLLKKFTNINENLVKEIISHNAYNYRNKITLHGQNKKLGLYQKGSNEIVGINECLLVNNKINEIIKELIKINENITKAVIKTSNDLTYSMVEIAGEVKNYSHLLDMVDVLIINKKSITKKSKILTTIGDKRYYESISSFFQVNKTLTKNLYDEVLKTVKEIHPNRVLDLYCGVGTIGIYVSEHCKEIIGIDYNESNISDANDNKELNQLSNIDFICDKVENRIDSFKDIDLIIVDPPRAGLDAKTRDYLKKINPKAIIYISCDPATLVRDLNKLETAYQVKYLKPFNMFPRTYHVECVSVLIRRDNNE